MILVINMIAVDNYKIILIKRIMVQTFGAVAFLYAVVISKFNKSVASVGDAQLQEDIGFKAESFKIDYKDVSPVLAFGWNFVTNSPL